MVCGDDYAELPSVASLDSAALNSFSATLGWLLHDSYGSKCCSLCIDVAGLLTVHRLSASHPVFTVMAALGLATSIYLWIFDKHRQEPAESC